MLHLIDYFLIKKHKEFVQLPLLKRGNQPVEIEWNQQKYYSTVFHLLYEPQIIGVSIPQDLMVDDALKEIKKLTIRDENQQPIILWQVAFVSYINLGEETVGIFKIDAVDLKVGWLQKQYINRFYKRDLKNNNFIIKTFNAAVYNKIISFFYYPKPVFLISTKAERSNNSFPVDTCRQVGNHFIFGVRASNKIMNAVAIDDVFCIGLSDFSKGNAIYELGNHSAEKNEISYIENTKYDISVPNIISKYCWVKLVQIDAHQTQNIYIAQMVSEEITVNPSPFLAHIHKFWLLKKQRSRSYNF